MGVIKAPREDGSVSPVKVFPQPRLPDAASMGDGRVKVEQRRVIINSL